MNLLKSPSICWLWRHQWPHSLHEDWNAPPGPYIEVVWCISEILYEVILRILWAVLVQGELNMTSLMACRGQMNGPPQASINFMEFKFVQMDLQLDFIRMDEEGSSLSSSICRHLIVTRNLQNCQTHCAVVPVLMGVTGLHSFQNPPWVASLFFTQFVKRFFFPKMM